MAAHLAPRQNNSLSPDLYTVGDFTIGHVLGVGSFGKVKLATLDPRRGGGEYAVKIIENDVARAAALTTHIRREFQAMLALGVHANVVALHSVVTMKNKVYIFMELVKGGDLGTEIVRKSRLSELRSRFYFGQLIVGLAACHARGIYHRDLRPENLLIDDSGLLKIKNFVMSSVRKQRSSSSTSLAAASFRQRELGSGGPACTLMTSLRDSTDTTLLHTQCGTPHFVAPEIITVSDEQGYSGATADVWSCGVILFVLVAGALPFDSDEPEVLFRMILGGQIQYPNHFSQPLIHLCKNLLQTDPKARFSLREIAESPWMTMPAEELANLCNEDVSLVPNYPDGYVLRFPWDESGDEIVPSLRLTNVSGNLYIDGGGDTSDLSGSPVVALDPTARVPSTPSSGLDGGDGEGVGVYDAPSHEAASLEPILPRAVGNHVLEDQRSFHSTAYMPQSHSQDSSIEAMAQIQNDISATQSAILGRSSESDGASAQGRMSPIVAAAAAAATAALPHGSRNQIAVVAAAAASAAANAVARSSAGSFQARSASSLEDSYETWRRKVEVDPSGATRPVYFADSAEKDAKSRHAVLNAQRAATEMANAAIDFASAKAGAERALSRAAAAANAAISAVGGRVAEHPQHGQMQANSHGQQRQKYHPHAQSQAGDQRHDHAMVANHRHFVQQLQEFQHDKQSQLEQLHARQLQRVYQAVQSEIGPQQAEGSSARPHT